MNAADPLPQVAQVAEDREDGHHLGGDGDPELALHQVAVLLPPIPMMMLRRAWAQCDHPAHLDGGRVDVQALELALGQARVVVVALMLHPRGEFDHRQVVRVHHRVDGRRSGPARTR